MTTVREQFGLSPVDSYKLSGLAAVKAPQVITSTDNIGIEIEIENVILAENPNRVWGIIEDGSLRNNGREFVSRPIQACAAPVALTYLFENYLPKNCCYSPRTSVHVHLNMQDFTMAQVYDYVLLYSLFEKLFYRFAGRGRQKNIYCVPLFDCDLLVQMVERRVSGEFWSKYTGLNLLPLLQYGTVEFRHMHGTNDVSKLCVWISLITKLKEYVRTHSTKDIRSAIGQMDDNFAFEDLLNSIFGEDVSHLKFGGLKDVTYLQAKQAIATRNNSVRIAQSVDTRNADFFKFKG